MEKKYDIFFEFIDAYSGIGFKGINNEDSLMIRLKKNLEINRQFFFISDLIKLQICYISPQVKSILGVEPEQFDPAYIVSTTHPNDSKRLAKGFSIELKNAREMLNNKSGVLLLSSSFRKRKVNNEYMQFLIQVYLFYQQFPFETVYALEVCTPIEEFPEIQSDYFHWYVGNDLTLFRYPDSSLLCIGNIFSNRELEIIQQIQAGLKTKEIAEKLFLSPATISTHRKNILKKSGKSTISELIFELSLTGMI